jgi:hypothetical protein
VGIVVTCPSCKYTSKVPQEYAGREVICPQCGNALRVPALGGGPAAAPGPGPASPPPLSSAAGRSCPSCQRTVSAAATVCIWCGTALDPASAAAPTAASPAGAPGPEGSRACPYCAETIKAAARKCPHCGEILDAQLAATRRGPGRVQQIVGRDLEKQSRDAFIMSLFAIFCCPIVLGPIAIIQGANVNKQLSQMGKPHNGLATAAIVLGIVALVFMVLMIFIQAAAGARLTPA